MASRKKPTTSTRTRGKDANPRKFKKKTSLSLSTKSSTWITKTSIFCHGS
jgi:hypothetical protein